jgi:hypothetical protein
MKKAFLTSIAGLFLATGTAHAKDPKSSIMLKVKSDMELLCGKLADEENKQGDERFMFLGKCERDDFLWDCVVKANKYRTRVARRVQECIGK